MKFEMRHAKQLSDEFKIRYMARKFPDEIAEMIDEIPQKKYSISFIIMTI